VSSAGAEVVAFAATAGLILDPWQQFVLDIMLGERADDVAEEEQAVDPLAAAVKPELVGSSSRGSVVCRGRVRRKLV
jgi:hypothetical protein